MNQAPRHSGSWKWWVCGLLFLASTINYMDRSTLANLAKRIRDELSLSNAEYGSLETGFGFAFAFGALLFGWLADKVNVRILYPAVLALWSAVGALTGAVTGFGQLLACRTLLGIFESGHWPCALKTTQRLLKPEDRTLGNSVLQAGVSIGAVITPIIISRLMSTEPGGWRSPFYIIGAVGSLWVVAWLLVVRKGSIQDPPSTLSHDPSGDGTHSSLFDVLRDRRLYVLCIVVICINLTWQIIRAWLQLYMQVGRGYSEKDVLQIITPTYYIATDVGCILAGFATVYFQRKGMHVHASRRFVFTLAALLVALGTVLPSLKKSPSAAPVAAQTSPTTSTPSASSPAAVQSVAAQTSATPNEGFWSRLITMFSGPEMWLLVIVGMGALGVFPCYYSLTQDLSTRHQGMVTGILSFVAWAVPAPIQIIVGKLADKSQGKDITESSSALTLRIVNFLWEKTQTPGSTGNAYNHIFVLTCWLPLFAAICLWLFWKAPERKSA